MKAFRYERPTEPGAAVAAHGGAPDARYLGGGTNLVDLMKLGVESPGLLVDVSGLPHSSIEPTTGGEGLRIGAAVRNSDLAADPRVLARYPVLSQALLAGASGQLRNAATVGGNLLQRTRCLYFQDVGKPCNKRDPGSGCPARDGVHRDLAILGASPHCVATHPSDMAVALAALDADVLVHGRHGPRTVPVTELHRLPGDHPERDTVLEPGDLITHIELGPVPEAARSVYRKARDRASFSFALASVAAALDVHDGTVRRVRLAFGAVAAKPWRAWTAEERLRGAPATAESFAQAVDAELAAAEPLRDNAFKIPLVRNLAIRALTDLASRRDAAGDRDPEASR
ncbi:xanthine dehydrogenase family protein subunit M [Streptomyces sp. PSKA54]|uniref:Xanthine dehydrogenase family protein subunit M n=1 Tax=Streptomyces himalayensis subsp. aureolus TaxID=2758039 RepID=A0A7W2D3A2_9ACTN|nr:xanthine dehydrogenase family protein subunit M [Streptomyces himalayensis]MBA4863680.1 xanthine dehydrogenase family protein subunit M [Streptomyces himalayensis subsp. aureolus]